MLAEPLFARRRNPGVNPRKAVTAPEKGGVRIAEAAFRAGNAGVFALLRFTAR